MISIAAPRHGYRKPWKFLTRLLSRPRRPAPDNHGGAEAARQRRAFILDMMHRHPEAFQSDLDLQYMMQSYPSRF